MTKLGKFFPKVIIIILVTTLVACFGLPLLSTLIGVSKAMRILWLFLIIDPLLTMAIAAIIKRQALPIWWIFLFPVVFTASIWWRFAKYNYWLAGVLLMLSLIIYLIVPAKQAQVAPKEHSFEA
ncbi:hypothetical protein [Lapidilactobacillus gannanensis]|uniref:Lipoprotein n=1 Tax=Lapidilactobacillus gannanensis TaxID=2486002 RepID=A0ABW4BNP1_9LACO|nr:hypothetical protein [Lapidilactobacillus gannanensis]